MKPKFPIFSSSRGLCGGKNVVLEDLTTDEPFIYRAERSGFCPFALRRRRSNETDEWRQAARKLPAADPVNHTQGSRNRHGGDWSRARPPVVALRNPASEFRSATTGGRARDQSPPWRLVASAAAGGSTSKSCVRILR